MKSAENWLVTLADKDPNDTDEILRIVRRRELEIYSAGLTKAAEIIESYLGKSWSIITMRDAILAFRENLTELPK